MDRRNFLKSIAAAAVVTASLRLSTVLDTSFLIGAIPCWLSFSNGAGEREVVPMQFNEVSGEAVYTVSGDREFLVDLKRAELAVNGEVFDLAELNDPRVISARGDGATFTVQLPELWHG